MYIYNGKRFNIYASATIDGITYPNFLNEAVRKKVGILEVAEPAIPADFTPDEWIRSDIDDAPYVLYTKKSDEQIAEIRIAKAKAQRSYLVSNIVVTTASGKTFDGHEDAQNRMARAIAGMLDSDSMPWVLADNTVSFVSKTELLEALRLAGQAQAALWVQPYQSN